MAEIQFDNLAHSYIKAPDGADDWALKPLDQRWEDGGAHALLGPSGCGKSTLLNIISGLVAPTTGRVLFDDEDVTALRPEQRNIAQVFQFPVVYDTMTVHQNLAFPMRNRGVAETDVQRRVGEIADILGLTSDLNRRAAGLTADAKQKISLGRGLVRDDVNAMLFDEPLTVIDPHLKWKLRSNLKLLHQRFDFTMIYVTHDQTEALTFADNIVVMNEGRVAQVGTPAELFERPRHTFVGHFIGSPGMNIVPCGIDNGCAVIAGRRIAIANANAALHRGGRNMELGVRPEHIRFCDDGIPVTVKRVDDVGRSRIVEITLADVRLKVFVLGNDALPDANPRIAFDPAYTHLYQNGWLAGEDAAHD
ncbi:MAG: ABC transporter ATP-binding protein [Gammaproteobacteria bacterium]|nr:ABC transporter ATP-binding protein [Gammaproteobacteria bacterium]MDD9870099.1 ABC transporter ATP-binding protein [Gammaproteobacteria bacterium]